METAYFSNKELLQDVKSLVENLINAGQPVAAQQVQDGLNLLNGLTDGWAELAASLEMVHIVSGAMLEEGQKSQLERILTAVRAILYC